jgi:hypothetical protein
MRSSSDMGSDLNHSGGAKPWLVLAIVLAVALAVSVFQTPLRINHDCASYIHMADMVLEGAVPYCGVIDINPPLAIYLHIPLAWFANSFRLSPIIVFQVCLILLLFVSAAEIFLVLRKRESGLRPAEQGAVLLAWMALFLLVDWRGDVGQREHLFVLTYMPYFFLRILRHRGGSVTVWFAVLLGLQAGVGLSLKPHFLLSAAAVEAALMLSTRRWRTLLQPECAAVAGVVAAYVAHWLFVPAAMREAFFCRWVPLICRGYRAFDASYRDIADDLFASPLLAAGLVGMLAAVLLLSVRRRQRLRLHLLSLATLAVMALGMLCFQRKGFTYHYIPFYVASLLCLLTVSLGAAPLVVSASGGKARSDRRRKPELRTVSQSSWGLIATRCLLLAVFGGALAVWFVGRPGSARPDTPDFTALRQIVTDHTRPGDRVLVMASAVRPTYPMLLQLGCRQSSRYSTAGIFALVYAGAQPTADRSLYHRYEEAPAEERQALDEYWDDVEHYQPKLIIVHNGARWFGLPEDFNMYDYLVYCGWAERSLKAYREIPGLKQWKVFERKPSPAGIAASR